MFGDTVNVAARVVAHAKPGQVLITKQAQRKLRAMQWRKFAIGQSLYRMRW